jgi:hypothetical protein
MHPAAVPFKMGRLYYHHSCVGECAKLSHCSCCPCRAIFSSRLWSSVNTLVSCHMHAVLATKALSSRQALDSFHSFEPIPLHPHPRRFTCCIKLHTPASYQHNCCNNSTPAVRSQSFTRRSRASGRGSSQPGSLQDAQQQHSTQSLAMQNL